jgi:natural product precursor
MKNNSSLKQLCLKKETIAHLDAREMENLKGGCTTETLDTCNDECIATIFAGQHKLSDNTCYTEG